ncbi:hypothetical protein DUNSADRAFT_7110 [Dunaliella salina]|uniref:Solute-binding protein family 3/N-terminal domain-containing protein n=1 Tax=Dunaliella salina TaxID=3046 RepID=A0ABQ7GM23_DUNSA|nr:hypothetical protein DUNSADRAFT_7110 [Dunaliella salina]|eukprot:KAF5835658.1 hypothetical protein DUNSADRAFT_7110 [Dunaliella salina]
MQGETYDSILFGVGRQLDMMCTWWGEAASRKSRSIEFTTPAVETSAILSTKVPRPTHPPFTKQFWTFLAPFSRDLWLVLLFGVLFSAVFLYIVDPKLEPATADAGGRVALPGQSDWSIMKALFNGINTMFYQAYTAQLTTFLIVELQRVSSINNLDDLIKSNQAACALVSVPAVRNFLRDQAPGLYVVPIKTIGEAFPAVREGKCGAALLGYSDAQINIAANTQCDMRIVGR